MVSVGGFDTLVRLYSLPRFWFVGLLYSTLLLHISFAGCWSTMTAIWAVDGFLCLHAPRCSERRQQCWFSIHWVNIIISNHLDCRKARLVKTHFGLY